MTLAQGKYTRNLALTLSLGLFGACNDAGFKTGQTQVADSKVADATRESVSEIPAQLETSGLSSSRLPDTIISSFQATVMQNANYRFKLDPKDAKLDFTLEDSVAPSTDSLTQINRTLITEAFTQGNAGSTVREEFDQSSKKGLADILVVIDDSGSMSQEQANLASKMNELLVSIKDSNWQISVITTSASVPAGVSVGSASSEGKEICKSTLIKAGEADAADKFSKAVNAGLSGSGSEQGIRQAVVGLRCTESPWLRPTSTLAVLIVSDEDNCSMDGSDCKNLPWGTENYLINYVEKNLQRIVGRTAGFYGIVAPSTALCSTAGNAAPQYLRLFDYKANGAVNYGNICDASYKSTLNRISNSIALLLNNQFELKAQPDAGTLKLSLLLSNGSRQDLDVSSYSQSGKVISFLSGKEPPAGSKVIAEYRVGSKPVLSSFTLKQDPAAGTLVAKVNGTPAASGSYMVSGRTVTFAMAPAEMAAITLDYRESKALLSRFKTSAAPVASSLKVSVNGKATTDFTFDTAQSEVVFKNPPADGNAVVIAYDKVIGPRLAYTLPVVQGASNFRITDQDKDVIFTQDGNMFTIGADAFKAGRVLTLHYERPEGPSAFEIGRMPVPGSADIVDSQGGCDLGMGLEIVDDRLISNCIVTSATEFTLKYQYIEKLKVFKVSGVSNPAAGTWRVLVNGEPTRDYVRSGSSFELNQEPASDARIDIHYTFPE